MFRVSSHWKIILLSVCYVYFLLGQNVFHLVLFLSTVWVLLRECPVFGVEVEEYLFNCVFPVVIQCLLCWVFTVVLN